MTTELIASYTQTDGFVPDTVFKAVSKPTEGPVARLPAHSETVKQATEEIQEVMRVYSECRKSQSINRDQAERLYKVAPELIVSAGLNSYTTAPSNVNFTVSMEGIGRWILDNVIKLIKYIFQLVKNGYKYAKDLIAVAFGYKESARKAAKRKEIWDSTLAEMRKLLGDQAYFLDDVNIDSAQFKNIPVTGLMMLDIQEYLANIKPMAEKLNKLKRAVNNTYRTAQGNLNAAEKLSAKATNDLKSGRFIAEDYIMEMSRLTDTSYLKDIDNLIASTLDDILKMELLKANTKYKNTEILIKDAIVSGTIINRADALLKFCDAIKTTKKPLSDVVNEALKGSRDLDEILDQLSNQEMIIPSQVTDFAIAANKAESVYTKFYTSLNTADNVDAGLATTIASMDMESEFTSCVNKLTDVYMTMMSVTNAVNAYNDAVYRESLAAEAAISKVRNQQIKLKLTEALGYMDELLIPAIAGQLKKLMKNVGLDFTYSI